MIKRPKVSKMPKGWTDNLETPPWLFESLDETFHFTMDGAADKKNALLPRFNSLADPRSFKEERVFLNPPYSNPGPLLAEARYSMLTVALLKGDPSVGWWRQYVEGKGLVIWGHRRIRFFYEGKPAPHAASFPSVLVFYLNEVFEQTGVNS